MLGRPYGNASRAWRPLAFWLLLFSASVSCRSESPPLEASSEDEPTQITRDFTTIESDSGRTRYVFSARIARTYSNDITRADDVVVIFHEDGVPASRLTSKHGILSRGRMTAEGDVVVVALDDSTTLRTETLYWDDELEKIRTDTYFSIIKDGDELTGQGLTSDAKLEFVDIVDLDARIENPESP